MADWKLIHCMCLLIFCCISNFVLFFTPPDGKKSFLSVSIGRMRAKKVGVLSDPDSAE